MEAEKMKSGAFKLWAILFLGIAFFFAGYQYASAVFCEEIAVLKKDYAERSRALEVKYRESEQLQNEKLILAWEERDKALASLRDRSADLDRLRKQATDARRRLSAAAGGACDAEREQLARCADLVERGADLVRRGVELSERTAIDKDALAGIVEQ